MDKTRRHDLEQLRREFKIEKDPNIRRAMDDAGRRIRREGKSIASMREALLKEHRKGKKGLDNIKDIQHTIEKDHKYRHHKAGY